MTIGLIFVEFIICQKTESRLYAIDFKIIVVFPINSKKNHYQHQLKT